jgi:AraC family transcriptional regulator
MAQPAYSSYAEWYSKGHVATYVRSRRSSGKILNLLEIVRPSGNYPKPAVPDLVLFQSMLGGKRVRGNAGWGRFDVASQKGSLYLSAPNFAADITIDGPSHTRSLSLPLAQWQDVVAQSSDGECLMENLRYSGQAFQSRVIQSALRTLWALSEDEGAPSRLLARAAGCEILAELFQLGGAPFAAAKGGLAPGVERRCRELMRARMAEDISLDELAAEAQLSPYHFARMFKQSVGVPPRVYLTQLRMEKACELLQQTELPITEIALEVGYSSNQVLARVFTKHQHMTPTEYRRAIWN